MRVSDASALLGKIVTLEMVGGIRLTTKIESVDRDPETGRFYMHTGRLLVFLMQHQKAHKTGKIGFGLVGVLPYGFPEMVPQKTNVLALDHVVLAQPAIEELATLFAEEQHAPGSFQEDA